MGALEYFDFSDLPFFCVQSGSAASLRRYKIHTDTHTHTCKGKPPHRQEPANIESVEGLSLRFCKLELLTQ